MRYETPAALGDTRHARHARGTWWRRAATRTLTIALGLAAALELRVLTAAERPAVIEAARSGGAQAVRLLLEKNIDVNAVDGDGTTALHWSAYRDDLETTELLIRAGANVNAANDLGATPLWLASQNGGVAIVRRLLQAGAQPDAALLAGETPLMVAARAGKADVVQLLAAGGANVDARGARGQSALMWAVAQKHPEVVKVLLAHGADVHARSKVWSQVMAVFPHGILDYNRDIPHGGDTPLMFASRVGDLASARLLVEAGADVNDADAWGVSALVLAAHSGFADLVEFLLERGANPNANEAGFTALQEAIIRRDERMVAALLARGADPNARLRTWTPTRRSSRDWNFPPEFVGATPLWLAARFAEPRLMRLLLDRGADPLFVHHASYHAGDPATPRNETLTPLMAATGMGGGAAWVRPARAEPEARVLEAVQLLAERGVDVNAANTDGRTALDSAHTLKYQSVVAYLLERGARHGVDSAEGAARRGPALPRD